VQSSLGARLVVAARLFIGVPYLYGGEDANGMDCSGLVYAALRRLGVTPPRVAADQARWGRPVTQAEARPGDLVFDGIPATHVGIYVGSGRMIDAPRTGLAVDERPVHSGSYFRRIP
jgi:cell wall-associated NlpC family hydrolase